MRSDNSSGDVSEGIRERKRRETRQRITEAGLKLFGANGFEATTLDAIAAEAGISRRTFFHYFKSKDEILLSLQGSLGERLVAALGEQPPTSHPLEATRQALASIVAPFGNAELLVIDRMMRSSEAVQNRKQASYMRDEGLLFAALRERWPSESDIALRLVATVTIGAARHSIDTWSAEGGTRPFAEVLQETFDAMESLFRS
jgi:AcrR family transcriptional regulator